MKIQWLKFLFLGLPLFIGTELYASTFHGELEVTIVDDFEHHRSTTHYFLHEDNGSTYELSFAPEMNANELLTGDQVTLEAETLKELDLNALKVSSLHMHKRISVIPQQLDKRNLVTMLINFTDKKTTDTVSKQTIDEQLYSGKTNSVRRFYTVTSFDQLSVLRDSNGDGRASIYVVDLNYPAGDTCDSKKWGQDAKATLMAQGVDLSIYKYQMFILPQDSKCPLGIGNLGCSKYCYSWISARPKNSRVMAHELGHNFGLDHSSSDTNNDGVMEEEYGDNTCVMGSHYREMNPAQRDRMHWFDALPDKLITVLSSNRYNIYTLDFMGTSNKSLLQVLKINKKDNTGTYYVAMRTRGEFGMSLENLDKVNIYKINNGDRHTYFITALAQGEQFVDEKNGITVRVEKIITNNATVDVSLN